MWLIKEKKSVFLGPVARNKVRPQKTSSLLSSAKRELAGEFLLMRSESLEKIVQFSVLRGTQRRRSLNCLKTIIFITAKKLYLYSFFMLVRIGTFSLFEFIRAFLL